MRKLVNAFNPATIPGLMCRRQISVDRTGRLSDCDFNQMLELGLTNDAPPTILDFDAAARSMPALVTRLPEAMSGEYFSCRDKD